MGNLISEEGMEGRQEAGDELVFFLTRCAEMEEKVKSWRAKYVMEFPHPRSMRGRCLRRGGRRLRSDRL